MRNTWLPANRYWQWMDNRFGPMGWFTDEGKREHKGGEDFQDGTWREIPEEEVAAANRDLTRLYREQC